MQLGPIWPSRLTLAGVPLGDCWRIRRSRRTTRPAGLVPLHKLSQWLTYSLIEPLQRAGFDGHRHRRPDGLAEYRNGGLFVDLGVLRLRDAADAERAHEVDSLLVVEWRALTVALLDRLAEKVRARLGRDAGVAAARQHARRRHLGRRPRRRVCAPPDGSPPIKVISDGTVFLEHASERVGTGFPRRSCSIKRSIRPWKASPSSIIRWSSTS